MKKKIVIVLAALSLAGVGKAGWGGWADGPTLECGFLYAISHGEDRLRALVRSWGISYNTRIAKDPHTLACQESVFNGHGEGILGPDQLRIRRFDEGWKTNWRANLFAGVSEAVNQEFKTEIDPRKWTRTCSVINTDQSEVQGIVFDPNTNSVTVTGLGSQAAKLTATNVAVSNSRFFMSFSAGGYEFNCGNFYRSMPPVQHLSCKVKRNGTYLGVLGLLPAENGNPCATGGKYKR